MLVRDIIPGFHPVMSSVAELLPSVVLAERTVPFLAGAQERLASAQGTLNVLSECIHEVASAAALAQRQAEAVGNLQAAELHPASREASRMLLNAHARVFIAREEDVSILTHQDAFRVLFHKSVEAFRNLVEVFQRSMDSLGIQNMFEILEAIHWFPSVNVSVVGLVDRRG